MNIPIDKILVLQGHNEESNISVILPSQKEERELLKECLKALNYVPKKVLPAGKYRDTAELAAKVSNFLNKKV